jgi:hypothetical protein
MTASQYYVYKVTRVETGEFYFGCRTVPYGRIEQDRCYLGSGRWPQQMKKVGVVLEKKVIEVFESREMAREKERELIVSHAVYPLCKNKQNTSYWLLSTEHKIISSLNSGWPQSYAAWVFKMSEAEIRRIRSRWMRNKRKQAQLSKATEFGAGRITIE